MVNAHGVENRFPYHVTKLLSFGTWYIFFMLIEHMGERPIAITIIVRSVYMLILIPVYGYGATANTLTSRFDRGTTATGNHEYPTPDRETFHVKRSARLAYMLCIPALRVIHLFQQ